MWAFFFTSLYLVAVRARMTGTSFSEVDFVFFSWTEPLMTSRAHKWLCWYRHLNHACSEGIFSALSSAFWWSFRIHRTTVVFVTFCLSELDCILILKKERIAALNGLNQWKRCFHFIPVCCACLALNTANYCSYWAPDVTASTNSKPQSDAIWLNRQ